MNIKPTKLIWFIIIPLVLLALFGLKYREEIFRDQLPQGTREDLFCIRAAMGYKYKTIGNVGSFIENTFNLKANIRPNCVYWDNDWLPFYRDLFYWTDLIGGLIIYYAILKYFNLIKNKLVSILLFIPYIIAFSYLSGTIVNW